MTQAVEAEVEVAHTVEAEVEVVKVAEDILVKPFVELLVGGGRTLKFH